MAEITKILTNAVDSGKLHIDEEISAKSNKIIAVGHRADGRMVMLGVDRPLKSNLTLAFINNSINSLNGKFKSADMAK